MLEFLNESAAKQNVKGIENTYLKSHINYSELCTYYQYTFCYTEHIESLGLI